jgi:hypothetical protein
VLYTVRPERMLMEQLEYDLLFRCRLNMDETVWLPTVFTMNRDRLLEGDSGAGWTRFTKNAVSRLGNSRGR